MRRPRNLVKRGGWYYARIHLGGKLYRRALGTRDMETARDRDGDGMYEWGPYGIIENVRDGWNVVFQLFSDGEDEGRG